MRNYFLVLALFVFAVGYVLYRSFVGMITKPFNQPFDMHQYTNSVQTLRDQRRRMKDVRRQQKDLMDDVRRRQEDLMQKQKQRIQDLKRY